MILWRTALAAALTSLALLASASGQASQGALRFFGTGNGQLDRLRIAVDDDQPGPDQSASVDVGAGSFSLELWIRGTLADNPTGNGGGDRETLDASWRNGNVLIDRSIQSGSGRGFGVSIAGGFVRFGTGPGDAPSTDAVHTLEGSTLVLDGAWHHVACVRDAVSGIKRIFVDGALDFESVAGVSFADLSYPNDGVPGSTPWDRFLVIGAEKQDAGPQHPAFAGRIDELRIWARALDASLVLSVYDRFIQGSTLGLVGYYRLEEGAGTAVFDASLAGGPVGELIAGIAGNGEWVSKAADANNTPLISFGSLPPGFQRTKLSNAFSEPTCLAALPDGRMLVGERGGAVRVVDASGALLATPMITLAVDTTNGERGILGMEVDPAFPSRPYLYLFHTSLAPKDRVSRFTVVGNQASPASELPLWEHDDPASDYHHAGGLAIGNDGALFVAVGDQLNSDNAQDLSEFGGKILRLDPDLGGPAAGNPFLGSPGVHPEIYAYGLRNPFRIEVDRVTGALWIGDVGGNTQDAQEEINLGAPGANYGWPLQEGPNCYASDCAGFQFPVWSYAHVDPSYYFPTPQGSVTLGPVYRDTAFPVKYQGSLFVGDYANRSIRRLVFDSEGGLVGDPIFYQTGGAGTVVDLTVGADGALYYLTFGVPFGGIPDEPALWRVAYTGSTNAAPVAVANATPDSGPSPLLVTFSSAGSVDPDSGPSALAYHWDFGDGSTSTTANPQHSYLGDGPFIAVLTLNDGADIDAVTVPISVGNAPTPTIATPAPGTGYDAGDLISFSGGATDAEDGVLPASALSWRVVLVHNEHVHPFLGPLTGAAQGSFTVPSSGHGPAHTYFRVELTARDQSGLETTETVDLHPHHTVLATHTLPQDVPLKVDGEPVPGSSLIESVVGFVHEVSAPALHQIGAAYWGFSCWSDGLGMTHNVPATGNGQNLTAVYELLADQTVSLAVPALDRNAMHSPLNGQQPSAALDPLALCVGRDGVGPLQAGMQFQVSVPSGAWILDARIEVTAATNNVLTPKAAIRAYDVGSAPVFVTGLPTALTAHAPLLGMQVDWVLPQFLPGQVYRSPNIAELIQSVVDRADFVSGNHVGLVLDGTSTVSAQVRCFANAASSTPPRLVLTYALPPSGMGCPAGCGFTSYGPAPSAAQKLALVAVGSPTPSGAVQFVTVGLENAPFALQLIAFGPLSAQFYAGTLLIDPATLFVLNLPVSDGETAWTLPFLPSPQYVGVSIYLQTIAPDATAPIGLALSNGLKVTVCP